MAWLLLRWTVQFDEQVPIELSSFVGSVMEDRVVLNWATVSQTNNAGFPRASQHGWRDLRGGQ